ncbi:MAG: hypothetical protein KIS92_12990 [Planctomycetota bacterium]|nr:hypothetical protein [Planctomycetota bacterium]
MKCRSLLLLAWMFATLGVTAGAATIDEAKALKKEADETLRKASGMSADPKTYADAVRKLEKASDILDEIAKSDPKSAEPMLEEITAALFWARKFANIEASNELNKDKDPVRVSRPAQPAAPPPANASDAAEQEFKKAEAFETAHTDDDYAVALRWFQVADKCTGTDWSVRALQRAQAAQARHRAAQDARKKDETPDGKLIAEGDALLQQQKPREALAKFLAAKQAADTVLAERRIGNTHLTLGYQGRDEYAKQYLPLQKRYQDAVRRGNMAEANNLRQQAAAMVARLKPLEASILKSYQDAEAAFKRGLDLAKSKDLDCEAHLAILQFDRKNRGSARLMFLDVLQKYPPANDEDRTLLEYCRSLLRLTGG